MQANNRADKNNIDITRPYPYRAAMNAIPMPTPADIEAAAEAKSLSIAAVCRRADIDPTAFQHWKAGKRMPNLGTVQKMIDAIEAAPCPST